MTAMDDPRLLELRVMVAEPVNEPPFTDEYLTTIINSTATLNKAAANIWTKKAAQYAALVDISEAGSSRAMSQLYSNALAMAAKYDSADTVASGGITGPGTTTRRIVRAGRS